MRATLKTMALCATLAAGAAFAVDAKTCADDAGMRGMRERVRLMDEQMDRIEWATDRDEQARLLDLHAKHMREGMREVRHRSLGRECRAEMMASIVEQLVRHQLVVSERDTR